ncbi:MAG: holo-ACP synthase [Cyanobacteria bacterium J06648_11]
MSLTGAIADVRLGTDVAYIPRFDEGWQRFGDRFLTKIYTAVERDYCLRSPAHTVSRLAGRWAAKEAAAKALGTGWHGVGYREIEVTRRPSGAPSIQLHGRAERLVRSWVGESGDWAWRLSFTHDREYAFATAVLLLLEDSARRAGSHE